MSLLHRLLGPSTRRVAARVGIATAVLATTTAALTVPGHAAGSVSATRSTATCTQPCIGPKLGPWHRAGRTLSTSAQLRSKPRPVASPKPSPSAATVSATPAPSPSASPAAGMPFAGRTLYQDVWNPARDQANAWRSTRPADAALMDRLAAQATARWFGSGDVLDPTSVTSRISAATSLGQIPVLVTYDIPQRDCGSYSAGGASSATAYRAWIRAFAAAIGTAEAVVIVEPDALAGLDCLSATGRSERLALLADAVDVLAANPRTMVYLDAGNSSWQPATVMATRLAQAGADRARGISLNVSNYQTTAAERSYGAAISTAYGRTLPVVIDTSRNGRGSNGEWCNPAGRAVGAEPVLGPSDAGVDAYLWVKIPGLSDGECNGGPSAGAWWDARGLELASLAWS